LREEEVRGEGWIKEKERRREGSAYKLHGANAGHAAELFVYDERHEGVGAEPQEIRYKAFVKA
jgi:hypothetical protein